MSNKSCCCIFVKSNGLFDKYANLDWNTFQSNIGYLQHKMMYNKLFFLDRSFQLTNWPKKKKCYFLFQRKSICFKYFPSYTRWKRKGQFPDFRISSSHFHQKCSPSLPTYFQTKLFRSFSSLSRIAFLPRSISLPLSMFCRPTFAGGSFEALIHTRPISVKLMQHCLLFVWNVLHFQATIFCCPFPNF